MQINNILLICPVFYGYEKIIRDELRHKVDKVYYKNEVPFKSPRLYYIIRRIFPQIERFLWRLYIHNVLTLIKRKSISDLLIIRGAYLPECLLYIVKTKYKVRIIQYQWDSVRNNPNALVIMKYAWRNVTFDMKDARDYKEFIYIPLFYHNKMQNDNPNIKKQDIDVLFISFWSYDRFEKFNQIRESCEREGLCLYSHIYMPFQSYVRRFLSGEKIPYRIISFNKINRKKYMELLQRTKIVFDVPSPSQVGSTMRTIESLSMKKMLLTTNFNVKKEQFYHSDNIYIWPLEIDISLGDIISRKFNNYSYDRIYPLSEWINKVLAK